MVGPFIPPLDRRYWALKRVALLFVVSVMMAAMLLATAGATLAAEAYKGKGNGHGWNYA